MFKKVLSMLMCIVMFVTCFSVTAIEAGAVYNAKSLFAITSAPVKDGVLHYTINVTAQQKNIAGAVILVEFDSTVLKPAYCSPAQTTNNNTGTTQNFDGQFVYGVSEDNPNMYSIAYMNTIAVSTNNAAKSFFNMVFEVIDEKRPKTDVTFYCKEYYSTSETDKNISASEGPVLIQEYKNIATLEAPESKEILPYGEGFKISWSEVTGADGYVVYRSTPSAGKTKVGECAGKSTTYFTDSGLQSGVTYTYTVTAVNNLGTESIESAGLSAMYIAKPEIDYVKNVAGGVEICWTKTDGAQFYNIMRRLKGETEWKKIASRSASLDTCYKDTTVEDGKEYEYDVNSATDIYVSSSSASGESIVYVKTPVFSSVTNTVNGIELKWPANSRATKYVIYKRAIGIDSALSEYAEVSSTTYVDTNVEPGKIYTYSIKVCTNNGDSAYNASGYTITRVPGTEVTGLYAEKASVKVSWKAVNGVDGYAIYRKVLSSQNWVKAGTVNNSTYSFSDSGVTSGTQYVYAVCPIINNSEGAKIASSSIYFIKAPTGVVAVNEIDGVKLSWDRVGGAVSYNITRKDSYGSVESVATVEGNTNVTYLDKNVQNGVTYTYNVVAINALGESKVSDNSNSLYRWSEAVKTTPNLAEGGIKVTWQAKSNATGYMVYRCVDNVWTLIGESKTAEYLDKDVVSNKTYSYAIGMVINGSVSAVHKASQPQLRYIAPATIVATTNGSNYTKVSWEAVAGATKYYLYKATSANGSYELVASFDSGTLSYVDKNVTAGKTVFYKTKCYNGQNTSVFSASKKSTFLEMPKIKAITNVYEGQKITWNSVAGATGYRLYRRVYGAKTWTYITTVDSKTLSYIDNGGTNGAIMSYTVRAANDDSYSTYKARSMTFIKATAVSVANANEGMYIKWEENEVANGYYVYRKVNGAKSWRRIAKVSTPYYTDKNVKSGNNYTYTVKAYKGKYLSGCDMAGCTLMYLERPTLRAATNGYGSMIFSWKAVNGAQSYRVYRKADKEKSWTYLGNTSGTSYTDKNIQNLSTYKYTVRAVNGKSVSKYYSGVSKKYMTAPALSVSNSTSGIYLSWNRITGATSYYLYRKAGNAKNWTKIGTITANSYLDTNVKAGVTYTYTIRAYGSKTLSGCYSKGWKIMHLKTPELLSVTSYKTGVQVNWSKVSYATGYAVYRKTENDKTWKLVANISGNAKVSFVDKNTEKGETYTYTVRAVNGKYKSWFRSGLSCKAKY